MDVIDQSIQSNLHWNRTNLPYPTNSAGIPRAQLNRQYELNIHKYPQRQSEWVNPSTIPFHLIKQSLVNLQSKELRIEHLVAQRIHYMNRNQHQTGKYFQKYQQILRILKKLYQCGLEEVSKKYLGLFFNITNKNKAKKLTDWTHLPNLDWLKFGIQYFTGIHQLSEKGMAACEELFNYLVQLIQTQEYVPLAVTLMSLISRIFIYFKLVKFDSKKLILILLNCTKLINPDEVLTNEWTLEEFLPKITKRKSLESKESNVSEINNKTKKKKKKKSSVSPIALDDDLGEPI